MPRIGATNGWFYDLCRHASSKHLEERFQRRKTPVIEEREHWEYDIKKTTCPLVSHLPFMAEQDYKSTVG
ncbi:hypothetical protein EYF80_007092 [Liparis tanakae]|uniref:Uncharacterized protein n=1 Tax=Liparis tanakae TaxID=230148 RepID=A0A4Z2IYG8_9TELE|nr:hypothetical protein EYF80_007092 [Liparis tanakae]